MKNLMKYEMRKTFSTKLILLGLTAILEILFLISLYADKSNLLAFSIVMLFIVAFGGILVIGLQSVLTLHRDMNTKQSYMLFMTPNSCYKILGAKLIENGLSILLSGAFFFALGALDITLLFAREASLQEMWDMFEQFIHSLNENIQLNAPGIACFLFSVLTGWIATVTAAFLSDVISSALLNGKKYNGILSFAIFLLLSLLMGWLDNRFVNSFSINRYFLVTGGVAIVLSLIMYFATAQIMERKLSV